MAYSTPPQLSLDYFVGPSDWNQQVDNVKWLAGDTGGMPSCRVFNSVQISIPNVTVTGLTFDSEHWDNGGMHSTSSNTSRLTIPAAGVYWVRGRIAWAENSAGTIRVLQLVVNGSTTIDRDSRVPVNAAWVVECQVGCHWRFSAGDYVELAAFQDSGVSLGIRSVANGLSAISLQFEAVWVSL